MPVSKIEHNSDAQLTAGVEHNSNARLIAGVCVPGVLQTWRQPSWQCGSHEGVFVQVQALIPLPLPADDDDTTDRDARDSSSKGHEAQAADGATGSGTPTLLNKTFFIRLRPDKPPS